MRTYTHCICNADKLQVRPTHPALLFGSMCLATSLISVEKSSNARRKTNEIFKDEIGIKNNVIKREIPQIC